jgi:hypothetical protein
MLNGADLAIASVYTVSHRSYVVTDWVKKHSEGPSGAVAAPRLEARDLYRAGMSMYCASRRHELAPVLARPAAVRRELVA